MLSAKVIKGRPARPSETPLHVAQRHVALCRAALAKEMRFCGLSDYDKLAELRRDLVAARANLDRVESGL